MNDCYYYIKQRKCILLLTYRSKRFKCRLFQLMLGKYESKYESKHESKHESILNIKEMLYFHTSPLIILLDLMHVPIVVVSFPFLSHSLLPL